MASGMGDRGGTPDLVSGRISALLAVLLAVFAAALAWSLPLGSPVRSSRALDADRLHVTTGDGLLYSCIRRDSCSWPSSEGSTFTPALPTSIL